MVLVEDSGDEFSSRPHADFLEDHLEVVLDGVRRQNRYNLADRGSAEVLEYCARHLIGFIPWAPVAAGQLARPGGLVDRAAAAHGASPSQVALAWLLAQSDVVLPIPGTAKVAHLEDNLAASKLRLSDAEIDELTGGA